MQYLRSASKWLTLTLTAISLMGLSGCKKSARIIEKVTFKPSQNLEVVRVSLVFGQKIKSDFAGSFALKDYGYLFLNPYTSSQPFEVGFDLNTSIVDEQDYIDISPTTVLPNGLPIGIPQAVVEIKSPNPIHPKFDLFGYVDVLEKSWLGLAAMFSTIDEYFPSGLSLSQSFLSNQQGRPGVFASVFGPTVGADGSVIRSGGVALFANVRQLIEDIKSGRITPDPEGEYIFEPAQEGVTLQGPEAPYYESHPRELKHLYRRLLDSMNPSDRHQP